SLAESLGVHRNTVISAYDELSAEGWVKTTPAAGTFVADVVPEPRLKGKICGSKTTDDRRQRTAACGFEIAAALPFDMPQRVAPGSRFLARSVPDVRLLPVAELARAYRRALRREGARLLTFGDPQGLPGLRAAFARMLRTARGIAVDADEMMVTRGSQMALDLIARTMIRPGDIVAVDGIGHPGIRAAFTRAGATIIPVPVDRDGMDIGVLTELIHDTTRRRDDQTTGRHGDEATTRLDRPGIRAIYVTPQHQFPTTVVLSEARRAALLELARLNGIAIIEDDYDHEFHYQGPTIAPLASLDRHNSVIYVGTLSKILAPGLRIGFTAAPRPVIER